MLQHHASAHVAANTRQSSLLAGGGTTIDQHVRSLQERVAELEEALKRERHRADLCQEQMEQCLAASAAAAAAAAAAASAMTSGGSHASLVGLGVHGGLVASGSSFSFMSGALGAGGMAAGLRSPGSLHSSGGSGAVTPHGLLRPHSGGHAVGHGCVEDEAAAGGSGEHDVPRRSRGSSRNPSASRLGPGAAAGAAAEGAATGAAGREAQQHHRAAEEGTGGWPVGAAGAAGSLRAGRAGEPAGPVAGGGAGAAGPAPAAVHATAVDAAELVPAAAPGAGSPFVCPQCSEHACASSPSLVARAAAAAAGDAPAAAEAAAAAAGPRPGSPALPEADPGVGPAAFGSVGDVPSPGAVPSSAPTCTGAPGSPPASGESWAGGGPAVVPVPLGYGAYGCGAPYMYGMCGNYDKDVEYVTITKREYELLLLKDKAMNVLQEGITIADCSLPDMPLIYANAGFVRTTGYSAEYVIGKNCRFLQGEGTDPATVRELRQAISEGKACVVQLLNHRKNGDPFVNYLSLTPIYDTSTARLTHYVGVQSDITELVRHKQAELAAKHAALQAAVATEAKSQFLARMSHEIRTPLNGMIAVGQLLAETSLTPAQWDLVQTIRCSGETLLTLITDILDFSRIEANKMVLHNAVFTLDTVIEAAMEIAGLKAAQRRLQVAYNISANTPRTLFGDAQRLQQVLLNVLNNAIKFTEDGELLLEVWHEGVFPPYAGAAAAAAATAPAVTPAAAAAAAAGQGAEGAEADAAATAAGAAAAVEGVLLPPADPVAAAAAPGGVHLPQPAQQAQQAPQGPEAAWPYIVLHFSVRDTGIGIAGSDLARLFNSFTQVDASHTRRYGGSGLGLAISRKLCEAMGGTMWAESDGLHKGSTFSWTITTRLPQRASSNRRGRRSSLVQVTRSGTAGPLAPTRGSVGRTASISSAQGFAQRTEAAARVSAEHSAASTIGADWQSPRPATVTGVMGAPAAQHAAAAAAGAQGVGGGSGVAAAGGGGSGGWTMERNGSSSLGLAHAPAAAAPAAAAAPTASVGSRGSSQQRYSYTGAFASATHAVAAVAAGSDGGTAGLYDNLGSYLSGSNLVGGAAESSSAASLPLLRGKKVLLVEPCRMVRQVLSLALRSWGCHVCAVVGEAEAIGKLVAGGTLPETLAPTPPAEAAGQQAAGRMQLRHAAQEGPEQAQQGQDERGPYDVVILDMKATCLLRALTRANDREAQRLVFLGWPGQDEPSDEVEDEGEDDSFPSYSQMPAVGAAAAGGDGGGGSCTTESTGSHTAALAAAGAGRGAAGPAGAGDGGEGSAPAAVPVARPSGSGACGGGDKPSLPRSMGSYDEFNALTSREAMTARPSRAVTDVMTATAHNRQLGYVTVTRPVRQGRLKLALEEVLMMALDAPEPSGVHTGYWSDEVEERLMPSAHLAGPSAAAAAAPGQRSSNQRSSKAGAPGTAAAAAWVAAISGQEPGHRASLKGTVGSGSDPLTHGSPMAPVVPSGRGNAGYTTFRARRGSSGGMGLLQGAPMRVAGASSNGMLAAALAELSASAAGRGRGPGSASTSGRGSLDAGQATPGQPAPAGQAQAQGQAQGQAPQAPGPSGPHFSPSSKALQAHPHAQGFGSTGHGHGPHHHQPPLSSSLRPALTSKSDSYSSLTDLTSTLAAAQHGALASGALGSGALGSGVLASGTSSPTHSNSAGAPAWGGSGAASGHSTGAGSMGVSGHGGSGGHAAHHGGYQGGHFGSGGSGAAPVATPRVRILLAEDNAINMKVALGILKRTLPTAEVVTVENGVQALEVVSARGGVDAFDLVLMDLHMPRMGGLEAVAELQQRYPNRCCRMVAVTADAFEDTRDTCMAAGFDGWLTKPFRVEDLVRVVGEHLLAARSAALAAAALPHAPGQGHPA